MSRKKTPFRILVYKDLFFVILLIVIGACSSDDNVVPVPEEEQQEEQEIAVEDKLPLFSITTDNGEEIINEPKIDAQMTLTEKGTVTYEGRIGIEIRGSTSQMFPKKSFSLETRDADGNGTDVSLLGFPEEEDWILHGPYSDKSLIRNMLNYDLSRDMGMYASRTQLVELNINEAYSGVYVFMEKLKRDKNRIDINKLKDDENSGEDLTGGYILKIDKGVDNQNSFASQYAPLGGSKGQEIRFIYNYPKLEKITPEQKDYIATYINNFETALASDNFSDSVNGYAAYMDVDSFIDFFILNELSNNVDGYRISTYMHKDKNEKLKMGPIWDFNLAFGNVDFCSGEETNVWAYKFNERCESYNTLIIPFWWERLLEDPAFVSRLQERWSTLRANTLSDVSILGKIDGYTDLMNKAGAIETNFETWSVLGVYVWPNIFIGDTYDDEMGYIKNWITDRTSWLDDGINGL